MFVKTIIGEISLPKNKIQKGFVFSLALLFVGTSAMGVFHANTTHNGRPKPLDNNPPVFGDPAPPNGSSDNLLSFSWSIPINDSEGDSFDWTIECSNAQTNSVPGDANGTKILALSGLAYSTTYTVWVNATDPTGSGQYTREWYTFTTKASLPPDFGSPSPANGSINQAVSFSWSIHISDPEGDLFDWTIQCSNGQTNGATDDSNGTKTLALFGLAYSTTYTVWVNATDSMGSGLYTRKWYLFSTKGDYPPVFGPPSPLNGSSGRPLSLTWSIPINDPDGDSFAWWIQCSNGQQSSGTGASNGTKSLGLSGLAYSTTYKVWVNATDPGGSGLYTRKWYVFTTKTNLPPVFGTPDPINGSTGKPLSLTWSIPISDPEGDLFNWWIQCSNGQQSSGTGATNGTESLGLSGLAYSKTYTVWVNATDPGGSGTYTRGWYVFTTVLDQPPYPPSDPDPSDGATNINISSVLSWTGGDPDQGDTVTYDVAFGTTTTPTIVVHNQSGSSYDPPGALAYNTTYYWQITAWDTYRKSTKGALWSFTTELAQDTTPPSVTITNPLPNFIHFNWRNLIYFRIPFFMTIVIGDINVMVDASDKQSGVERVEFWTNGQKRYTDTTAPYNWSWTDRGIFQIDLRVVAYDHAGHQNDSSLMLWKIRIF